MKPVTAKYWFNYRADEIIKKKKKIVEIKRRNKKNETKWEQVLWEKRLFFSDAPCSIYDLLCVCVPLCYTGVLSLQEVVCDTSTPKICCISIKYTFHLS